ncbi:hypothetical protein VULLAG_LOCUS3815 [Vulpes lagopus]
MDDRPGSGYLELCLCPQSGRPVLGNIRKFRVSYKNREILGKEFHRVKEEESHPDKDNHFVPKPRAIKKSSNNVP